MFSSYSTARRRIFSVWSLLWNFITAFFLNKNRDGRKREKGTDERKRVLECGLWEEKKTSCGHWRRRRDVVGGRCRWLVTSILRKEGGTDLEGVQKFNICKRKKKNLHRKPAKRWNHNQQRWDIYYTCHNLIAWHRLCRWVLRGSGWVTDLTERNSRSANSMTPRQLPSN